MESFKPKKVFGFVSIALIFSTVDMFKMKSLTQSTDEVREERNSIQRAVNLYPYLYMLRVRNHHVDNSDFDEEIKKWFAKLFKGSLKRLSVADLESYRTVHIVSLKNGFPFLNFVFIYRYGIYRLKLKSFLSLMCKKSSEILKSINVITALSLSQKIQ
jgi:hypothetical protein